MERLLHLFFGLFLLSISTTAFAADANLGQTTYQRACIACHMPQTAGPLGSPAVHDTKAWAERFKIAESQSGPGKKYKTALDYLVSRIRAGVKGSKSMMPAGGNCIDDTQANKQCTDEVYKAAILFMSKEAK